ncbi:MAG: helix-hairpin-helix domain-containing protein [Eubacterium sp.]|nr:helix-hairpin-helix domain-containing protein [Eubacterium sp.]
MKSSKRQSLIIIGFGLIILSGIILYFSLSMPKISLDNTVGKTTEQITGYQAEQTTDYKGNSTLNDVSNVVTQSQGYNEGAPSTVTYPLNLNTCTAEELMTIDGIGEVKASYILEYRDYLGGYTSVEQIKNIKGIGESTFEKISPYLTV